MVNLLAEDRRMMKHVKKNYQTGEYNALVNNKRKETYCGSVCKLEISRTKLVNPKLGKADRKRTVRFVSVGKDTI